MIILMDMKKKVGPDSKQDLDPYFMIRIHLNMKWNTGNEDTASLNNFIGI